MVILRYFRFICISGVVVSGVSFLCGTVAIATGSWLLSQGEVHPSQLQPQPAPDDTNPGPVASWNLSDSGNNTDDNATAAAHTPITELTTVPGQSTAVPGSQETGTTVPSQSDTPGNVSTSETEQNKVIATSGLWHICQADIRDGVVISEWICWNVIQNLAEMNTRQLMFFQSMLAFELISVAATLAGCCIASVAIYKRQPLAVLVAAFTMFFAGMFMLVGHLMMLSIHKANNDSSTGATENRWYYGWSFILAWHSFGLCLVSGVINCIVYRNFRKMSEELTGTPSRVKYANRPPPVSLGSSI